MTKMAAVRPGHSWIHNNDLNTNTPNFDALGSDNSIQITDLVYGDQTSGASAHVVDSNGTSVTADYELLRGIKFPVGSAYCHCDFNQNGRMEVQDIFDFLSAWFLGCTPSNQPTGCGGKNADFNGNSELEVQDIFDFLSCWFAAGDCGHTWDVSTNGYMDISFEYTLDGQIYSRSDFAHSDYSTSPTKLVFAYDTLGRRIDMAVAPGGGVDVADSIEHTTYAYDVLDQLTLATAEARDHEHGGTSGCLYPVATNIFRHDSFGNLTSEKLLHGGVTDDAVNPLSYSGNTPPHQTAAPPGAKPPSSRGSRA